MLDPFFIYQPSKDLVYMGCLHMSFLGPIAKLPSKAIASGYRNNCAYHCIAHTWLSLPAAKIRELYKKYPIYRRIITKFCSYYNLPDPANVDTFIEIMQSKPFSHPIVRERIWGQVLREINRELLPPAQAAELRDGALVANDALHPLVKAMGANLIIHSAVTEVVEIENADFQIEMFHEGAHYNFTYGDPVLNQTHNALMEARSAKQPEFIGQITDLAFRQAESLVGVKEQDAQIRVLVRTQILTPPVAGKVDQAPAGPVPGIPAPIPAPQPVSARHPMIQPLLLRNQIAQAVPSRVPVAQPVVGLPVVQPVASPAAAKEDDLAKAIRLSALSLQAERNNDADLERAMLLSLGGSQLQPARPFIPSGAPAVAPAPQRAQAPASVPAASVPAAASAPAASSASPAAALSPAAARAAANLQAARERALARKALLDARSRAKR